jgi:hypothetical protein
MRSRSLIAGLLAVAALGAVAATPAGANTLSYGGSLSSTADPTLPFIRVDQNGATTCSSTVLPTVGSSGNRARAFAFRNASASSDCITVTTSNPNCSSLGQAVFTFSGVFPDTSLLGSDSLGGCADTESYSFNAPAGQLFSTFVLGAADTPFGLSVSGTNVAPVHAIGASGVPLPGGNTLSVNASSLEDGSAVQGTLSDDAGAGHHYGGPVRCLRVSGHTASLVMTFDGTQQGLASKWKGAVYWLRQDPSGTSDGQRNSLLTQHQLDTTYASCPDPGAPLGGSFKNTGTGQQMLIVANGAQS